MGAEGEGTTRAGSRFERSGWGGVTIGSRARMLVFGASVIALVGVAALVGALGGWTARPARTGVRALPTLPTRTQSAPSRARPKIEQPVPDTSNQAAAWVWLLVAAVVAIVVFLLLRRAWDARRRIGERQRLQPEPGSESGVQLDEEPPPPVPEPSAGRQFDARAAADAIVSCWVWVEEWAAARGSPRMSFETPTEFLDRVVGSVLDGPSEPARVSGPATAPDPGSAAAQEDRVPDGRAQHTTRRRTAAQVLLPLYQRARFDVEALDPASAVRARDAALTVCGKDPVEAG